MIERFDRRRTEQAIEEASASGLLTIRAELVAFKKLLESQLSDGKADLNEERAELMSRGMHPAEANWRATNAADPDWRARTTALIRIVDTLLGKIRSRLGTMTAERVSVAGAVVLAGCGRDATKAAAALNDFLSRGCKVHAFNVVGDDLVVVANEPKEQS